MAAEALYARPWVRTLGLALTIVALFFLLWQSDESSEPVDAAALRGESEPDGFVVNGRYLSFDETGQLTAQFESPRIEQFEARSETIMASPNATLYGDPGDAPWQVQANKGQFMEADDLVHLTGDVRVSQQAQGGRPLTLTTSTLTLDNAERTVYTDAPVKLTDSFSLTRATGMKAWIDDRILELDSQVEGRYEPGK
ncbi:LPS export ABC transporter periplasmic protein LptC [Marinobacter sp.]|jgi:lipopolysaccharide export system protein LptC|uniref:LPS export ABC transporter periplasmic protein LptC n=1 Tax=Marinobacter sp. TaxID=50741 RepID=UPI000C109554|nr:LPS export ABC transporter periplasmic protein LptC [Marinobacter sp.]PHQ73709.1 MAG: LPS export ABC transporter periplasmic protein LptC [Marinobacter sp.]|tara:strand:+ start:485 stop:1075 length:591 start_codon:yes stop_codon:yes gene_type:complete